MDTVVLTEGFHDDGGIDALDFCIITWNRNGQRLHRMPFEMCDGIPAA